MKKHRRLLHKKQLRKKRSITLLYHSFTREELRRYYSEEHAITDEDTESIIKYMKKLFFKNNYDVRVVKIGTNDLSNLKKIKSSYVFNLVDSKKMELRIARVLDRLKIPHSGSTFKTIQLLNNKVYAKKILDKNLIPTPKYSVLRLKDRIKKSIVPSKYPVIIKPAYEHCSIGITNNSIATNYEQFKNIVKTLRKKYRQTLIVEQFIEGKEFQVTVLETPTQTIALPIAEIIFKGKVKNKWNIYGFDEKWRKNLPIYKSCQFVSPPKSIKNGIDSKIKRDAIRTFHLFGLRDYARMDLRYDPYGKKWYFLEANANAGISPGDGDAMTASIYAHGLTIEKFVLQIVTNSIR